jgi:hypothetical protein
MAFVQEYVSDAEFFLFLSFLQSLALIGGIVILAA